MTTSRLIYLAAFITAVLCSEVHYEVPEPTIEVFSPKGMRISIQDSRSIEEVEFIVTVPGVSEPLVHRAHKPDRGHWAYWNPDVVVHLYEKIRYKLMVKHLGLYCQREGVYVVQKIIGINDTDCEENQGGQKFITGFSGLNDHDRHLGRFASGKSSSFQSSYSTYKNAGMKPITKSSTSTTSGTFYLKPSGEVEGSGYKSGSTFDSTKSEGEQWKHYRSELTAEELEEIRRSGLHGLDLISKLFPEGIKNYDQSYIESRLRHFPGLRDGEVKAQFHQTHETHESSSYSQGKPTLRFQFEDMSRADALSSGAKSGGSYQSSSHAFNAQPQTEGFYQSTEYRREEHTVPGSRVHITREPPKVVMLSHTKEYSSRNHEASQPVSTMHTSESRMHESRADQYNQQNYNVGRANSRQDYESRTYGGSVFKYYTSSIPRYPDECVVIPGSDYTPADNLRQVEKFAYELSCLSSIAEVNTRKEMESLRQKNHELNRKLELLERKFLQFESTCKCY